MLRDMKFSEQTPYENLDPNVILSAVESLGYRTSGAFNALNSYENRVYEIALDDNDPVVVKFYRPNRWTSEQIEEEHVFANDLQEVDVDVIPPLEIDGKTLHEYEDYRFSIYEKRVGRSIELKSDEDFRHMGRLVARIHSAGSQKEFTNRLSLNVKTYGWDNLQFLRESGMIPADMMTAYDVTVTNLLNRLDTIWNSRQFHLRVHGDCHMGNILDDGQQGMMQVFFVDLDDALTAPAVQDLWMFASGEKHEFTRQMSLLIDGYKQIREFNYSELDLVEPLRALRMIHYTAWLARRWSDPTFPRSFPFFNTSNYWENHLLQLKEQIAALDEPVLVQI